MFLIWFTVIWMIVNCIDFFFELNNCIDDSYSRMQDIIGRINIGFERYNPTRQTYINQTNLHYTSISNDCLLIIFPNFVRLHFVLIINNSHTWLQNMIKRILNNIDTIKQQKRDNFFYRNQFIFFFSIHDYRKHLNSLHSHRQVSNSH